MSKMDRVDLTSLRSCCVGAVYAVVELAAPGQVLWCAAGHRLVYKCGRWTRPDHRHC
jgi:hypothetical protein